MAIDIKKFTARFVDEAREHIGQLGGGLAALDGAARDQGTIDLIFRAAHTIKGSSRMLKLLSISDTAHQMEEVLSALRDERLAYTPQLGQLLYRALDALAALVELVSAGLPLPAPDAALCGELARVAAGSSGEETPQQAAMESDSTPDTTPLANPARAAAKGIDTVRVRLEKLDELIKLMGEVISGQGRARQRLLDWRRLERSARGAIDNDSATGTAGGAAQARGLAHTMRKFGQDLRDDVLAQELLVDELHGKLLLMRMLPLAILFDPVGPTVRELARGIGKQVECAIHGADMELDRQIIDKLGDPIMHLLRNALDHGIESQQQRLAAGKPASGRIAVGARQDGAAIVITIADDGAGIDHEALRHKAVRKGLLTQAQADGLSRREAIDLMFLPGLSTSAILTDISGRGVGMDVVKRCIVDELQGQIEADTEPGRGTTFSLRLPLSLALTRVLLVSAHGQCFGIGAQHIVELLRVPEQDLATLAGRPALDLQGQFVPVAELAALLKLPPRADGALRSKNGAARPLLLLRVGPEKLALRVDALLDQREMVIKPLPGHMRALPLVAGMITTGNNELVSVLHVPALLAAARGVHADRSSPGDGIGPEKTRRRILVVDDSPYTRDIEKDVLEAHGYSVELANDGEQGLRQAMDEQFDAVLTDIEMPLMDGFELTRRLRAEQRYGDTPIIIITSLEKEADKRRGIAVGADAYIVKGDFDQSNLIGILHNLLG